MANDLSSLAETAIVRATIALRNNSVTPRLVSSDFQGDAAKKDQIISVPVHPAIPLQNVTAGRGSYNTPTDITPSDIPITLDNWKEAVFSLSDKEIAEIDTDAKVLPPTMDRAVIAHGDGVDTWVLLKLAQSAYTAAANSGPAVAADIVDMRTALNVNNVDPRERRAVYSHTLDGELMKVAAFQNADQRGDTDGMMEGQLGRKFGFDNWSSGNMPTITKGDAATRTVNGAHTATPGFSGGLSTIATTGGTGDHLPGDLITFAGDTQVYCCESVAAGGVSVTISPMLKISLTGGEAVSYAGGYATSAVGALGFHRSAFALATRPLQTQTTPGTIVSQATDSVSGVSLRMTIEYANKQVYWSIDMLYGGRVVYPEAIYRMTD
jgi:hypothetical protein